jgi:predicted PurR-regulated permease PerM
LSEGSPRVSCEEAAVKSVKKVVSRKTETKHMLRPTPIWISKRTRTVLLLAALVALVLLVWAAPSIPVMMLGGFALALIMSFPVRALSRFMPRGLAILVSFLSLVGLVILAFAILVPLLIIQLSSFISTVPDFVSDANEVLRAQLEPLAERGLLPGTPDEFMANLSADLLSRAQGIAEQVLGGLAGFVSGTFSLVLNLFGVVFVAVYMLLNVRSIKVIYLLMVPVRYRRDARDLWDAFAFSLSRFLTGLGLVIAIQGTLSAIALYILGVPYALLLGVWVSISAIIPYLGAWLGAIPAVILALFESPLTAVLTAVVFLLIQQLEGNYLTPRIQGQSLRVPSILVFLAVIAGGEIAGLLGVIFAVPTLAVVRVLFDFFRVRLRTSTETNEG